MADQEAANPKAILPSMELFEKKRKENKTKQNKSIHSCFVLTAVKEQ
jgi:hypothetical protein